MSEKIMTIAAEILSRITDADRQTASDQALNSWAVRTAEIQPEKIETVNEGTLKALYKDGSRIYYDW